MSRRKRVHAAEGTLLAGWLFADLLLALSVVFLGVVPGPPKKEKIVPPPITPPTTIAAGLDSNAICLGTVKIKEAEDAQYKAIRTLLTGAQADGRRVGFMIITGGEKGTGSVGKRDAKALGERLKNGTFGSEIEKEFYDSPQSGTDNWAYDSFKNGDRPAGDVTLKALFYNQTDAKKFVESTDCGD